MIGKAEWFRIRKYGGWGISPANKKGWLYIAGMILPLVILQSIPWLSETVKEVVKTIWTVILILDVLDIMLHLKKDEREKIHEAMAERNAAWWMIGVLTVGLLIETVKMASEGVVYFDPVIVVAILGGAVVKGISHWYLRDK